MTNEKPKSRFGFWKTTVIGGLLFLLPLIVLGALVGQIVPIVLSIAEVLHGILPVKTPGGIALLLLLAVLVLLLLCFLAGLAARRSFAKRISAFFERNLTMLFPRYMVIKEQMKGSVGGENQKPQMKPVLVRIENFQRVGFEMDRMDDQLVCIYMPGSPDAWTGSIVYIKPDQVEPLPMEFNDVLGISESLGRNSIQLVTRR